MQTAHSVKDHEGRISGTSLYVGGNHSSREVNLSSSLNDNDCENVFCSQAKRCKTKAENSARTTSLRLFNMDFKSAFIDMENIDRSFEMTVINAISLYPAILQEVATTATALPPTQVSVKKLFSALPLLALI